MDHTQPSSASTSVEVTPDSKRHDTSSPAPKVQDAPSSPVKIHTPAIQVQGPYSATIENGSIKMRAAHGATGGERDESSPARLDRNPSPSREHLDANSTRTDSLGRSQGTSISEDNLTSLPIRPASQTHVRNLSAPTIEADSDFGVARVTPPTPTIHLDSPNGEIPEPQQQPPLQYHHMIVEEEEEKRRKVAEEEEQRRKRSLQRASQGTIATLQSSSSEGHTVSSSDQSPKARPRSRISRMIARPGSTLSLGADLQPRGRSSTPPGLRKSSIYGRGLSTASGGSPDTRPVSTIDLLNIPYAQQMAHQLHTLEHAKLQAAVGTNASLLDTRKTLEMYRANVKKTTDMGVQYEFALLLIHAAQEAAARTWGTSPNIQGDGGLSTARDQKELLREARTILQRLADRGYAFAQYYLADGYSSGFFNDGKEDPDRAFPFFIAAGKHGHAEAAYRTALCYEFGWGCRRDPAKASQFHRQAASRGHPGAAVRLGKACLTGDMGLGGRYREGAKWLKRATEGADHQHNSAPYELGLLHVSGYGADVFKDEGYAAQLFTQAADLGHPEANMRMGEVYEHGLLTCPRDPALSIHFYHSAAQGGLPEAMMALCAWYMVGADPVLAKDESEAYEWAKKAAATDFPKADYAVGYFTEMGIGCRRDPLEANARYVRAADHGDERAKQRLIIIRAAESSAAGATPSPPSSAGLRPGGGGRKSSGGIKTIKKKRSMLSMGSSQNGLNDVGEKGGGGGKEDEKEEGAGKDEKDCMVM